MREGTVIRRGSTWTVVLDLGKGPDGKRIRNWHPGYPNEKAAERARVELLAALGRTSISVGPGSGCAGRWSPSVTRWW